MTNDELNKYILHYLTEDKTHSAIMLTGDWGTGKSYYIQNSLKPFLENDENGKHKCIVVSLYGLKDLFEVSKALYLECRMKFLNGSSEKAVTGKFAAKTVLKGITSFFGIDLSKTEEEMQTLYDSVDLSGKLIIIEDLERSGISIIEILGYVNNLVEQDGGKVLLVANEKEILKYSDSEPDKDGKTYKIPDENTELYLRTKEKTVSDTILFDGDYFASVKHIMTGFNEKYFNLFLIDSAISELLALLRNNGITNLRTFIFACQKANDIFEYIKPDSKNDYDFIKTIFYGIILFTQKIKTGTKAKWKGGQNFSTTLASEKYPLFRFCFDYVMRQTLDKSRVDGAKEALRYLRLYDKEKSYNDKDLKILYSWWVCPETDVFEAVESISSRLQNEADISFYEYGRIALYMVGASSITGCDISRAKDLLIKNLNNKGNMISADYIFTTFFSDDEKPEVKKEFEQLKEDMTSSLAVKNLAIFDFDYDPKNIAEFQNSVFLHCDEVISEGAFMSRLNIDKIVEMLKCCTAANIQEFRGAFLSIYKSENIRYYLEDDKDTLEKLLDKVRELSSYDGFDKIQKMQIRFFEDNLNKIIAKL